MTQEIIGSEPSISDIKIIFEKELIILVEKIRINFKRKFR